MAKRALLLMLVVISFMAFVGCTTYGDNSEQRLTSHLELHLLAPYRQLVELHREIDYFIFNLDETNPNLY